LYEGKYKFFKLEENFIIFVVLTKKPFTNKIYEKSNNGAINKLIKLTI